MECQTNSGRVLEIESFAGREELKVEVDGVVCNAINFPHITGNCLVNDKVLLNTTACALHLGTGGYHFVMAIYDRERSLSSSAGHIMKLRYTPSQGRVLSLEEEDSPYHSCIKTMDTIDGMPVIVGSLHSMLAPIALAFHQCLPQRKLVYLMSDGAALPLGLSRVVERLKQAQVLSSTITFGHAFGGDLEAVNVYSALLGARYACQADAVVILMGPGVVGTNTAWGTTAVEQGDYLNAVYTLKGTGIGVLRMSMADKRPRHQGISHHTLTALGKIATSPCEIAVPKLAATIPAIQQRLADLQHNIHPIDTEGFTHLLSGDISLSSMGRTPEDDPLFFHAALAAGVLAAHFVEPDTIDLR